MHSFRCLLTDSPRGVSPTVDPSARSFASDGPCDEDDPYPCRSTSTIAHSSERRISHEIQQTVSRHSRRRSCGNTGPSHQRDTQQARLRPTDESGIHQWRSVRPRRVNLLSQPVREEGRSLLPSRLSDVAWASSAMIVWLGKDRRTAQQRLSRDISLLTLPRVHFDHDARCSVVSQRWWPRMSFQRLY